MFIAFLDYDVHSPEWTVGIVAVMGLAAAALVVVIRWFCTGPVPADPWGSQVAAELEEDTAVPLCHHCLSPHDPSADFCPECGAAVGQYTNLLPFPYLFSLGQGLRLGTEGDFKHSGLTVFGYLLLGLAEYLWFAPVYWVVFLMNLSRRPASPGDVPPVTFPPPLPPESAN